MWAGFGRPALNAQSLHIPILERLEGFWTAEFIEFAVAGPGKFDYNNISGRVAPKPGQLVEFAKQSVLAAHPMWCMV